MFENVFVPPRNLFFVLEKPFHIFSHMRGSEIKKELSKCSVLFDLPADNNLRTGLLEMKQQLEGLVDKFLGPELSVSGDDSQPTMLFLEVLIANPRYESSGCNMLQVECRNG